MKILLIHYRYFIAGGPERYMFNIIEKLQSEGHEVVPFSVKSNKNIESKYSDYFVKPIDSVDSVYFDEYKKSPRVILQLLKRSFFDKGVEQAVEKIIDDTQPDAVYVMCYLNKLSPSVIRAAKNKGRRVVVRLSEYGLMCPKNVFLYNNDICEDCVTIGYSSCIKKRCVKNSIAASLIRVASMKFHDLIHIYDDVDAFITPSDFLRKKLYQYKFGKDKKVYHIPTFSSPDAQRAPEYITSNYAVYLGRISPEKGLEYVIQAYKKLGPKYTLIVIGALDTDEAQKLTTYVKKEELKNIEFVGSKFGKELIDYVSKSKYVLLPSIWYDNFPNVVLEAYMNGKPVIASNLGSMPEMVVHGQTGMLFEPKNVDDIIKCIKALDDESFLKKLSQNAFQYLQDNFSAELHYKKLMEVLKNEAD